MKQYDRPNIFSYQSDSIDVLKQTVDQHLNFFEHILYYPSTYVSQRDKMIDNKNEPIFINDLENNTKRRLPKDAEDSFKIWRSFETDILIMSDAIKRIFNSGQEHPEFFLKCHRRLTVISDRAIEFSDDLKDIIFEDDLVNIYESELYTIYSEIRRSIKWVNKYTLYTPPKILEPNTNKYQTFYDDLNQLGFFSIASVNTLGSLSQQILIQRLYESKDSYKIAVLYQLGFISVLQNRLITSSKVHETLAKLFGASDRTIKGHINSMNPNSKDRTRYLAFQYVDQVNKDIEMIKSGHAPLDAPK